MKAFLCDKGSTSNPSSVGGRRCVIDKDIDEVLHDEIDWKSLAGKTVAITGANGMLAAYIVETLLALNNDLSVPVHVVALVRNPMKAQKRFSRWRGDTNLEVRQWTCACKDIDIRNCNILIHAASIPRPDSLRPVDVIAPNVMGTWNLLEYVRRECNEFEQFLFFSSCAVYGDEVADNLPVDESKCFPLDQMNPTSCYAESKKMGENICVSFMRQYGIPVKILRYAHTYGPGMDFDNDPRSFVQFMRCAIDGRDIELHTSGEMVRYFCYVTDATRALFRILFLGEDGAAYNIANREGRVSIYNLAQIIAELSGGNSKVLMNVRASGETGYAPRRFAINPCTERIRALGFIPVVSIRDGFARVMAYYTAKE